MAKLASATTQDSNYEYREFLQLTNCIQADKNTFSLVQISKGTTAGLGYLEVGWNAYETILPRYVTS